MKRKERLVRERILNFLAEERKLCEENPVPSVQVPKTKRDKFINKRCKETTPISKRCKETPKTAKIVNPTKQSLLSCLVTTSIDSRIPGGANNPAERYVGILPRTDSECKFNAPGIRFLTKGQVMVATQEIKIAPIPSVEKGLKHKCDFFPKYEDKSPFKDKNTQTLYRESSAQTLAYLPPVECTGKFELSSMPSLLPGKGPPGVHEVELLERSRKRWAFLEAVKANFQVKLRDARAKAIKTDYKTILEAFEWEQWLQREEDIQECQMMRLGIVIKMFDKREKEMHNASRKRIEKSCEEIEKRRQAGLLKNEIQYQRGMRRLETQHPRKWKKQKAMEAVGSVCSEFYGPLQRHGVDPARRSFVPKSGHEAFDMRIDDLEKTVNMRNLVCPFRKLKEWSKPVEKVKEFEQNFLNEANLQNMFVSLKTLRNLGTKEKEPPKCRHMRPAMRSTREGSRFDMFDVRGLYDSNRKLSREPSKLKSVNKITDPLSKGQYKRICDLNRMENMLKLIESSTIGWVMQFLGDEMVRLLEQRRLHYFCMLAQKERWQREALESGLRQKETHIRILYEHLFQECNSVHNEIADKYLNVILTTDVSMVSEIQAASVITEEAKLLDIENERWLESFKLIQNPMTFVPLRLMLKDMISPDLAGAQRRHESTLVVKHIVEDVIFQHVWEVLDPFDIGTTLISDLIDRLIDNDLYLFSTDSESDTPQKMSWKEARAIIRKLIRQAVPGNRWKEETERIVLENYNDLFDDIFARIFFNMDNPEPADSENMWALRPATSQNFIKLTDDIREKETFDYASNRDRPSATGSEFMGLKTLSLTQKSKGDNITGELTNYEIYPGSDQFENDVFLKSITILPVKPVLLDLDQDIFSVGSAPDLPQETNFKAFKHSKALLIPEKEIQIPIEPIDLPAFLTEDNTVPVYGDKSDEPTNDTNNNSKSDNSKSDPKDSHKPRDQKKPGHNPHPVILTNKVVEKVIKADTKKNKASRHKSVSALASATDSETKTYSTQFSTLKLFGSADRSSVVTYRESESSEDDSAAKKDTNKKTDKPLSLKHIDDKETKNADTTGSIFNTGLTAVVGQNNSDEQVPVKRSTLNSKTSLK